jgi:hypothetical protein
MKRKLNRSLKVFETHAGALHDRAPVTELIIRRDFTGRSPVVARSFENRLGVALKKGFNEIRKLLWDQGSSQLGKVRSISSAQHFLGQVTSKLEQGLKIEV